MPVCQNEVGLTPFSKSRFRGREGFDCNHAVLSIYHFALEYSPFSADIFLLVISALPHYPKKIQQKIQLGKRCPAVFLLYLQFFKADQHDLKGSQLCAEGKGTIQIQKTEGHFRLQGSVEHAQALRG